MTRTITLALAALALTACSTTDGAERAADAPAGDVHTFTSGADGFDTHAYFYDSGEEVVVFDAQFTPALAEQMLADIRATTDSPIRYVVVTHANPDKFNGASVFQAAGAQIVASRQTADAMPAVHDYKSAYFIGAGMFTAQTYPALPSPDVVFDGAHTLELAGGARVELTVLTHAGVTSSQTVAFVPEARALFVGDLVHHGAHAWLEGAVDSGAPRPDLAAWRDALSELLAFDGATVYAGRGDAAPVADAVASQRDYLAEVARLRGAYLADHAGPYTADDHAALAAAIKAAFPERGLGYLVDYSVYGLFAGE
jgi:glyoxylase-like metal-dependent hydrolase (beta-lactamase superfamily II)